MKTGLFTLKDYGKENRKTRPIPKRDRGVAPTSIDNTPKCVRCGGKSVRKIIEEGTTEEFYLCQDCFDKHQRKHMYFKPYFEKASTLLEDL